MTKPITAYAVQNIKTGKLEKDIPIHWTKADAREEMFCNSRCFPIENFKIVKIKILFE